jgi:hypothetical protein
MGKVTTIANGDVYIAREKTCRRDAGATPLVFRPCPEWIFLLHPNRLEYSPAL